jgi:hypothetical protein
MASGPFHVWPTVSHHVFRLLFHPSANTSRKFVEGITEAERVIGFPMPPLLRRLYLEVGNGGFGPGVLGVPGCRYVGAVFEDIADLYREGPDPSGAIPAGVVLLHDWGCAMWTLVDFRDPAGPIWGTDDGKVFQEGMVLSEWLTYRLRRRPGMAQALEIADIPLEGRRHRGVDDAWNIGALILRLRDLGAWPAVAGGAQQVASSS